MNWIRMRTYYRKYNISGPTPMPLFGNLLTVMNKGFDVYDDEILKKYNRVAGYFEGSTPVILISDPKLIKAIGIKDSAHFINRRVNIL